MRREKALRRTLRLPPVASLLLFWGAVRPNEPLLEEGGKLRVQKHLVKTIMR